MAAHPFHQEIDRLVAGDDGRAKTEALRRLGVEVNFVRAALAIPECRLGRATLAGQGLEYRPRIRRCGIRCRGVRRCRFTAGGAGRPRGIDHQYIRSHDEHRLARRVPIGPPCRQSPAARMRCDGGDPARHLQGLAEANGAALLDPVDDVNRRMIRMIGQDGLGVERNRLARDESRVGMAAIEALVDPAMTVQTALFGFGYDDVEDRKFVSDFGAVGNGIGHWVQSAPFGSATKSLWVSPRRRTSACSNRPCLANSRWHSGRL